MSREKPDRAACIYVPEPDGPGHMILWRCSCSSDERRPSLEREKNKKSQYIKSLIYWPSLNYKIWGKQEIESKSGEAIKRQILSQKWKGKKKRFKWDYGGTCLLKHLCNNYDLRDNLIRRLLFLVPTVFSKCWFHDATLTSVTFKEAHINSWDSLLVSKVSPVGKFHCI